MEARIAIAEALDGMTYDELVKGNILSIAKDAQNHGCVIIYGMSDDNLEFTGAINDEVGAYEGTKAYIRNGKLLTPRCEECEDCDSYIDQRNLAIEITALWDHMGYSWFIISSCPSTPFVIYKFGETFCRGIVIEV